MKRLESFYHKDDGHYLIELKLAEIQQLFNTLDPFPYRERDLHPRTEDYLVGAAQEFPPRTPLKIRIYLSADELRSTEVSMVRQAMQNFFRYKAELSRRRLFEKLREGRSSLLIGLAFLVSCLLARAAIGEPQPGSVLEILSEGLLISGWVAMWRPVQIFLYDWWPIRKQIRLYDKLSQTEVELRQAG